MIDLAGGLHSLGQNDRQRVRVFVFLSPECPISNGFTQTLNQLTARHTGRVTEADRRVDFFGVVSDPTVTRAAAAKHYREFAGGFTVLFDASGLLRESLAPTHVPEAFVVGASGELLYRGAIDNSWEDLGRRRPKAERLFLADAIDAALAGRAPAVARTTPVGCVLEPVSRLPGPAGPAVDQPASPAPPAVTYTRDIAPIIQASCLNCHREGQVAPFALADYRQVASRAGQIARVTHRRIMPPWIPDQSGETSGRRFVGDRRLTDREIALIDAWASSGKVEGDPADLPDPPQFAEGWRLGTPDLILRMAEPFPVPADGPDILQNFVIPTGTLEDKLVAAIEFHPGSKRVVHHAVLFLDDRGAARRLDALTPEPGYGKFGGPGFAPSGALGGWSVGNTPRALPGGMGRYLKQGSDLVMQIHYHPSGKAETDQSEVGLYFVKEPLAQSLKSPAQLVGSIWMANYEMDIPAGESDYRRSCSYVLPKDVIMVGVVPHMHLLGKAMKVTATPPGDGSGGPAAPETLINITNWNYNWQDEYYFERPFTLKAGTRLDVHAVFDNSADNPSNPSSPPARVTWGEETNNEMLFCFFLLTAEKAEDLIHVIYDNLAHDARQPRSPVK